MDPNPVMVHPSDTIGVTAGKIMQRRYRSLPVVDDDRRFLGVVTVNCMLYLVLPKAATMKMGVDSIAYFDTTLDDLRSRLRRHIDKPVSVCLDEDVVVVDPNTPQLETLLTLYHAKSNLPVVDKMSGRLEGMISYYDVGAAILNGSQKLGQPRAMAGEGTEISNRVPPVKLQSEGFISYRAGCG